MFDDKDYTDYKDAYESLQYRSRMKTLLWEQWGYCPVCEVRDGNPCKNTLGSKNPHKIKRFRMRPHWERYLIVYPDCWDCGGTGYLLDPLRECEECDGKGQFWDQPSEQWWYEVWQEIGGDLWALNNQ